MNTQKLLELAGQLVLAGVKNHPEEIDEISEKLAAELRQKDKQKSEKESSSSPIEKDICGFLKFDNKEISKMPKSFRHTFRAEGQTIFYRKRKRGKYYGSGSYEARYRRHGYNISVSATSLEELRKRFIEALHEHEQKRKFPTIPTTFKEFSIYYFENFRKRKVKPETFKRNMHELNNHLIPEFESTPLKLISPVQCQELLDDYIRRGFGRTAEELHTLLNQTFKMAIAHGILERNPLNIVIKEKHKRVHGKRLTLEEEKLLLEKTAGTRYQLLFAVALYTGLRPNEYRTARIEGAFIVAINSKRKTHDIEYKKIPITPMLRPYLEGIEELHFPRLDYMRNKMKEILPNHTLKDLRKTFNTHCEECGILPLARKFFMGHSLKELDEAYTEPSDEFLLKEGEKFKY